MRLLGILHNQSKAAAFGRILNAHGILHMVEEETQTDWSHESYGNREFRFWIENEEDLEKALLDFRQFLQEDSLLHPKESLSVENAFKNGSAFSLEPPTATLSTHFKENSPREMATKRNIQASPWSDKPMGWITSAFLALCIFLFALTHLLQSTLFSSDKYAGLMLFSSPVERELLYDYPKLYERLFQFIRLYGVEGLEHPEELSGDGALLYRQINKTAVWPGYYQLLLKEGWKGVQEGLSKYPSFEKIRQGQLWRLFTPCLLHGDLFHIFFNMLWLIALGKQIEQRLAPLRYLLLILLLGIISNTAQYLMSGPNFVGFSGILVGMLAFIWARQRQAAWEGYQIDRSTFIFMLIFVLSMAAIQIFSFFIEKSFALALSPNIANMAHLSGGLMGYLIGRSEFFSWRYR